MPPKFKFTKDEIIDTALNLIRSKSWSALTTRTLAEHLGSSARPIYSYFKSMEALDEAVVQKGVSLLHTHMVRKRTGDPWQDHGIGYVMFAQEEKNLFKGLNDEKRIRYFKYFGDVIWEKLTASLADYPPFKGLSSEQVYQIQLTRWLYAQGLAFQVCNQPAGTWDDEKIIFMMRQGSTAIYEGLKKAFTLA
ncbi:transcriptional regulator, TetR family [Desulfosarcina variabilis str. Montpellier]